MGDDGRLIRSGSASRALRKGFPADGGLRAWPARRCKSHATGVLAGEIWLDCPGTAGTGHPHRASACTDIATVHGDVDALPGRDEANCWAGITRVVATAHGTYRHLPGP
ncbi:SSI family serine proteinase inhibitor [Streptomyces sp. NPDC058486]|uniref:SSI family serine proteinase inhibitor n=1 Tax=unclassified Streptomyces TaxID=2593676 RepID=UPI00365B3EA8